MKRMTMIVICLCILLCGCGSWTDGYYVSVKPHTSQQQQTGQQIRQVENYTQLRIALAEMIEAGTEAAVFSVEKMTQTSVKSNMDLAIRYVTARNPVGAYAVDTITYEVGTSSGKPALAITATYIHNRAEIRAIKETEDMDTAKSIIYQALDNCNESLVLRIGRYNELDFAQLVKDYADEHPESVMEQPQVAVSIYPESGNDRVVELKFHYQTSRDSLRSMQSRVQTVFMSAELYVRGEASDREKYSQLYSFLMERYDYQLDTSITPAYSLLHHGVGDSKAFAVVYASMCRKAGLECVAVPGTRDGEPWFWNIVCDEGVYYHVDLLRSSKNGKLRLRGDGDMDGYVWDYSAYPACGVEPEPEETTVSTIPVPTSEE